MTKDTYDLIVIGGGPGGYVAAIRAAQLGMQVACIDANAHLGGTCLRVGCIPSKALLESSERFAETRDHAGDHGILVGDVGLDLAQMHQRKDSVVNTLSTGIQALLRQHQVDVVRGWAALAGGGNVQLESDANGQTDGGGQKQTISAPHILLAPGSRPATLPGVEPDGERIGTSSDALAYGEVPQRLVVIGAGYIGLELGSVWRRLGAEVIVLETLEHILPGMDSEMARTARRMFSKQGIQFQLGTRVQSATCQEDRCVVRCQGAEPIECDRLLVAVGRRANIQRLGLASVGIEPNEQGEISIDDQFRTSVEGIYAIGDCVRGPKLAHKASHEAIACVNALAGQPSHMNYDTIPAVVYTHPEIASVGATQEQLEETQRAFRKGHFPLQASGRARTLGQPEGFVKVLADAETDRILGVHIIGPRAGDLIAEAAAAMEFGASAEDLASLCHAHPTLAESIGEAALDVKQMAIHAMPQRAKRKKG